MPISALVIPRVPSVNVLQGRGRLRRRLPARLERRLAARTCLRFRESRRRSYGKPPRGYARLDGCGS
jgi:hypothetical protein